MGQVRWKASTAPCVAFSTDLLLVYVRVVLPFSTACGLGHELDGGRRVGGKRDHASSAGLRATAWGPCQVVVSDWNPDMPNGKRAKVLFNPAARVNRAKPYCSVFE